MSGKIVGEVMRYAPEDLTVAQRFVLVALAESARDAGPGARISHTNTTAISQGTGLTIGTVRNAIVELTRRCLIAPQLDRSKVGRGRLAQQYRITQLEAHHRAATTRSDTCLSAPKTTGSTPTPTTADAAATSAEQRNASTPLNGEPKPTHGPETTDYPTASSTVHLLTRIGAVDAAHAAMEKRQQSVRQPGDAEPIASSPSDAIDPSKRHPPVTLRPVDNSEPANGKRHRETLVASLPSDTNRVNLPVTTVSSNSSRQVTVDGDGREGSPTSLRSVALEDHAAAPSLWSRAGP